MTSFWHAAGRVTFWLSWPLLYLYLLRTERTRVVVIYQDYVLLVRGWLGDGRWGLPGGGLHHGEDPVEGTLRELKEETGIEVNATDLQKLYSRSTKTNHGLRYFAHVYGLQLKSKPELSKQRFELTHIEWVKTEELLADTRTSPDVREAVAAFCDK